jgi:hypothetical protein
VGVDVMSFAVAIIAKCDQIAVAILPRLPAPNITPVMNVEWDVIGIAVTATPRIPLHNL